jgi:hypothetical protein
MPNVPSSTKDKPDVLKIYEGRISEDFLLQQFEYHTGRESYRDQKDKLQRGDLLYDGDLRGLFTDESSLPEVPLTENKFKNALHDFSRLACNGRGMARSIARGDRDRDDIAARVRESIYDTYWTINQGRLLERKLYMDLAGAGMMAGCVYYDTSSPYPQMSRYDPRYLYPDVHNGRLVSCVYAQRVKERVASQLYPDFGLDSDAKNSDEVMLVTFHGPKESVEAIVRTNLQGKGEAAYITQRWPHDLGIVPVAFRQLDSYDSAIRGILDQMAGPMMARNKMVRFQIDQMEQTAHAPIVELGVSNADEPPGPFTIYHLDPNEEHAQMGRLAPANASGTFWNTLSYLDDQEQKEGIQPPARVGQVRQSIASGSFVASTQGQLTSLIEELQENMAEFRRQTGVVMNMVDERFMDEQKPLIHPVGKKKTYTPTKDIDGWYHHEITYGAGAGLDKLNADGRVLNHLSARLIPRSVARQQIDYLSDSTSVDEDIDAENVKDALLQRFATDPRTPMSALANVASAMEDDGLSLVQALKAIVPELVTAEQQVQGAAGEAAPAGAPAEPGIAAAPAPSLPQAPLQQVLVR